jgi:hypothetical protein
LARLGGPSLSRGVGGVLHVGCQKGESIVVVAAAIGIGIGFGTGSGLGFVSAGSGLGFVGAGSSACGFVVFEFVISVELRRWDGRDGGDEDGELENSDELHRAAGITNAEPKYELNPPAGDGSSMQRCWKNENRTAVNAIELKANKPKNEWKKEM